MKVKAAIHYEFHKLLVMEEVELDPPGDNDVLIRIAATGICHSDIHCMHGEHGNHPLPGIGGHEVCWCIAEVGKKVTYVKPGDKVIATIMPVGCGECYYCTIGHGVGEKLDAFTPREFCIGRMLTGSAIGAVRSRLDIPRIIELYQASRLKLDELVSGHFKFDQINEAMQSMEKGDVIRNVLMFD